MGKGMGRGGGGRGGGSGRGGGMRFGGGGGRGAGGGGGGGQPGPSSFGIPAGFASPREDGTGDETELTALREQVQALEQSLEQMKARLAQLEEERK